MSGRRARRDRVAAAQAQERRVAERTGGSRNAGSGSFDRKGDVRVSHTSQHDTTAQLWEMKRTDKSQITVKADDLETNVRQARQLGRRPVFGIHVRGRDYVLLPEGDHVEAQERIEELKAQVRALGGDPE